MFAADDGWTEGIVPPDDASLEPYVYTETPLPFGMERFSMSDSREVSDPPEVYTAAYRRFYAATGSCSRYQKEHHGLFSDRDWTPATGDNRLDSDATTEIVELEYDGPDGRALITHQGSGVSIRFMDGDGRTAVSNYYYASAGYSKGVFTQFVCKQARNPDWEDAFDPDALPDFSPNDLKAVRVHLMRHYSKDRIPRELGCAKPHPVASAQELEVVSRILEGARPVTKTFDDVTKAIDRQLAHPGPGAAPSARTADWLSPARTTNVYRRLFDGYRKEVMTPAETLSWEGQTIRTRDLPDGSRLTVETAMKPELLIREENGNTYISLTRTETAGDALLDRLTDRERETVRLSYGAQGELLTELRLMQRDGTLSAELTRSIRLHGGGITNLGRLRFEPQTPLLRVVRNCMWGDIIAGKSDGSTAQR